MSKVKQLPPRGKVKPSDCWNLDSLFKSDAAWETAFKKWENEIPGYNRFASRLGDSAKSRKKPPAVALQSRPPAARGEC
jgi:oligoendopeptidase F